MQKNKSPNAMEIPQHQDAVNAVPPDFACKKRTRVFNADGTFRPTFAVFRRKTPGLLRPVHTQTRTTRLLSAVYLRTYSFPSLFLGI